MAKTTMQDIANALDISRVTVWKVFNNYEGVSEDLKKQIINKAQELGYSKALPIQEALSPLDKEEYTISVIVSRPESAIFWTNIIHQLAKDFTHQNISLMYTYVPSTYSTNYSLPTILSNGTVDGIVILNVYDQKMLRLINQLDIPKVFLDTVPEMPCNKLSGDVIFIEGTCSVHSLTSHLIEQGHTNIGFIGDIQYAQTNLDRYNGFLLALKDYELDIQPHLYLTKKLGIYSYQKEIHDFLNNLSTMPTAFVCVSDYVALFLYKYLTENNYNVPEDVAITGFDGSQEYTEIMDIITTVNVNTKAVGNRLSRQIQFRIEHPKAPYEATYIQSEIKYRLSSVHKIQ
jgi:LacI family transcriptional regulator